jgi:arylsulfatase A-like enzyme
MRGKSEAGNRGDSVMLADWCLGRIMETLDDEGVVENTVLIFTSDNGAKACDYFGRTYGHKANGDLRGHKTDIFEGGHRIPFVARWPEMISPGTVSHSLFGLVDLMATVIEMTGYEAFEDDGPDSVSFLPLLADPEAAIRKTLINHSSKGMFAIRSKEWKLVDGLGSGGSSQPSFHKPERPGETGQLYDMRDDFWEQLNKYLSEPDIVGKMSSDLVKIKKENKKESVNPS